MRTSISASCEYEYLGPSSAGSSSISGGSEYYVQ